MIRRTAKLDRRRFLGRSIGAIATGVAGSALVSRAADVSEPSRNRPNVVYVFADQWRAQATGYAGDPNARTPNLDALAKESVNFVNAISGCPVCSPYRGSFITGQYWLTHGVFLNDVPLRDEAVSIAEAYKQAGYHTAYIGKWHLDGHGRSSFIPRERRQGFDFWKVLECTHSYNNSLYYADEDAKLKWEGYDAIAQTREAERYIRGHGDDKPFLLVLSWGPPHNPYETAPEAYRKLFSPETIVLRANVPPEQAEQARQDLAGYCAHIAALDACVGDLLRALHESGKDENTVFVFTSDHGDMLYSQGQQRKQRPYDESIRVPFLLRYPAGLGRTGCAVDTLINTPDIAPTLLGLCGVPVPGTMEGADLSAVLLRGETPDIDAALVMCAAPFGEWTRAKGGREYRGIRTKRYTYCRDLNGPWLLFDNEKDTYQQDNVCNRTEFAEIQTRLDEQLTHKLRETNDEFRPAKYYIEKWGCTVDANGTVPYAP